jgi:hypothetical protein
MVRRGWVYRAADLPVVATVAAARVAALAAVSAI